MIKMIKLKEIDATELVSDTRNGITKLEKTYKCGDKVFRITYENSNGYPLGFNYKMCLSQYNGEEWKNLEDVRSIKDKIGDTPSYYSSNARQHCLNFFDVMEKRIINIYA